jgi:signal peptidase II
VSASSPTPAADPTRPLRQPADALHWTVFAVIMLVTVAADQLTQKIARDNFSANDPFEVLPFLQFTKTWNTGIAFGQFRDNQSIVIILSIVAIAWMLLYFARSGGRSPVLPVAIGLLAGGAVSNLFDRLAQGRVTDFLQISRFPVFNLADVAITVGVILLLLVLLAGERQARA